MTLPLLAQFPAVARGVQQRLDAEAVETADELQRELYALLQPYVDGMIAAGELLQRLGHARVSPARDAVLAAEVRRATAHHEAGHAVVIHLHGGEVVAITLDPPSEHLSLGHVLHRDAPGMGPLGAVSELAGPIAEQVAGFEAPSLNQHRESAARLVLDVAPGFDLAERTAFLHFAEVRARSWVARYWPHIEAVAAGLLRAGTLTRDQFLTVFNHATEAQCWTDLLPISGASAPLDANDPNPDRP